jgi:M6 family metalloprotease-like protein
MGLSPSAHSFLMASSTLSAYGGVNIVMLSAVKARIPSRTLLFTLVASFGPLLYAQGNSAAARMRQLNNDLLRIQGQANQASPSEAAQLHSQAAAVFQERVEALVALIQTDAAEALKQALPSGVLDTLAATFPELASQLESQGSWQGPVDYLIADYPDKTHRAIRRMKVGSEVLEIEFAGPEPPGLKSGDILSVHGVRAGNTVAAADGNVSGSIVAPATCSTKGAQSVATILVEFPDYKLAGGVDQELMKGILYGNSSTTKTNSPDWSVDDFWQQNSDGQASAPVTNGIVVGPYQLSQDFNASGNCDYMGILNAALAAADGAVYFPNYSRVLIVLPNNGACGWAGLGSIGCWSNSSPGDGGFTASVTWERSDQTASRSMGVRLATHELGHNLTMNHASSRAYPGPPPIPLGALSDAGVLSEYGDYFSTMGYWNFGYYSAHHALQQLGWLQSGTNVQAVETSGAYSVQAYETRPQGLKALKIRRGTGNDAWLWLEYRQNSGIYDSQLNSQVFTGALIHYQDSTTGSYTHLLDFTPANDFTQVALAVGQSWTDPYSNLSLSVDSASGGNLYLTVNYGPVPCVQANPTVSISPSNATVTNGSAAYTVTVKNNDSVGCSSSTFQLSSSLPIGWGTAFSPLSLSIAPGLSGSSTMTKTAPGGTSPGPYTVDAKATDGSSSGSNTATATVPAPPPPLTVTVAASPSNISLGGTVKITATVQSGTNPAVSASVTFTMTDPKGGKTTKKMTTATNGTAVWSYKSNKRDPAGTYSVTATATYGGQAATTSPGTSFLAK